VGEIRTDSHDAGRGALMQMMMTMMTMMM